ncbi:Pyridoxamine 5'-phosphate oxidase [Halogranum amylolyticum]|uniref:Pyridoxamine 5'-phosphate oxidase n=1 Tax=Halogranum amylolyticum TaxID=660520 RepID=A0A1H8UBM2_9EURY|nr:pyridoxamine 5'-phosphate oxidase family protein [Halogranum amylolyticum]SEP00263.1 Pyridoxamine 5'-phosphate oxidase [Halogranum amylolyticum]
MPRDYDKIALSDQKRAELLEEVPVMRFATVDADGLPHVVPVQFAEVEGAICFETDDDSIKTQNVRATGKAAAVVDAGGHDYIQHRGIMWRGDARVVDDRETIEKIERALFGTVKSIDGADGHDRVKIALDPRTEVTWDFRQLAP